MSITVLIIIAINALFLCACVKEKEVNYSGIPVINQVRLVDSTKRDSTFSQALPGTILLIEGQNLGGITSVYFNDYPATFNPNYNTNGNLIISIPADAPTEAIKSDVPNKIRIVTTHGETTYDFALVPPNPSVSYIENENTLPGEKMTIYGSDLRLIQRVVFPGGLESTDFTTATDGKTLIVRVPANLTASGTIKIISKFGEGTSTQIVNYTDGPTMLANFDGKNNTVNPENNPGFILAPIENNPADFPGNRGNYSHFKAANVGANNFGYRAGWRAIYTPQRNWIPDANLNDPLNSWALKFEIFAKKFDAGCLIIVKDPGSYDRSHRFEPWNTTFIQPGTKITYPNYKTGKWVTITIPFNEFLNKANGNDGTGIPATDMRNFLDIDQFSNTTPKAKLNELLRMYLITGGQTISADGVEFAIDNVRAVKIK